MSEACPHYVLSYTDDLVPSYGTRSGVTRPFFLHLYTYKTYKNVKMQLISEWISGFVAGEGQICAADHFWAAILAIVGK